jgi:hypothetical protein
MKRKTGREFTPLGREMGQIGITLPYAEWLISMATIIPTADVFDTTAQTTHSG